MGRPGKKAHRLSVIGADGEDGGSGPLTATLSARFDRKAPESSYRQHVPREHRRRYGQFFTPEPIARLMLEWVRPAAQEVLLDPAVGPGVFLRLARELAPAPRLVGVDVDAVALEAARRSVGTEGCTLVLDDFLTWQDEGQYDAIVANPPYLRHHDMTYPFDVHAEIGRRNGIALTRLANLYVLFILEICRRLSPGGRAAVIVPGEWTNANFGTALKRYLLSTGCLRRLVYFSNLSAQFEDALTTAAILLVEKPVTAGTDAAPVATYFVEAGARLEDVRAAVFRASGAAAGVIGRSFDREALLALAKWDHALRDGLPQARPGFVTVGAIAATSRGIATGANAFFHLTDAAVQRHRIADANLKRCVGRADDVKGLVFTHADYEALRARGGRTWLLSFSQDPTAPEKRYLAQGSTQGMPERFLLASRTPWYSMEQRAPAPIWATVFGRKSLRFIYNDAGVHNLTTFHGIYPTRTDALYCRALVACLNSRLVQSLAAHQRRVYGGGLMKFEPRDLLAIPLPDLAGASADVLEELAALLLQMDAETRASGAVSEETTKAIDVLIEERLHRAESRR